MPEASIRAVELVRSIREAHYASLKDLSPSEKIAFFQEKARALHTELGRPGELPDASASGRTDKRSVRGSGERRP